MQTSCSSLWWFLKHLILKIKLSSDCFRVWRVLSFLQTRLNFVGFCRSGHSECGSWDVCLSSSIVSDDEPSSKSVTSTRQRHLRVVSCGYAHASHGILKREAMESICSFEYVTASLNKRDIMGASRNVHLLGREMRQTIMTNIFHDWDTQHPHGQLNVCFFSI